MKIFISWSGERSKLLAEGLRSWLPGVINAAEPWLSSSDIEPGSRWGPELARQLEETKYGILCITAENLNAPWLLFEAGALSKYVKESRVVPLVLDVKPTDIQGPLAQFQAVRATEKEINKLVTKINQAVFEASEIGVNPSVIDNAFQLWWPQLKDCIDNIPKVIQGVRKSKRSQEEIVEEILTLVRKMDNRVAQDHESVGSFTIPGRELSIADFYELQASNVRNEMEALDFKLQDLSGKLRYLEANQGKTSDEDERKKQVYLLQEERVKCEAQLNDLQIRHRDFIEESRKLRANMIGSARNRPSKRIPQTKGSK